MRGLLNALVRLATPIVSILGFWYLIIYISGMPEFVIPFPGRVLATLYNERGYFAYHLWQTLESSLLGYVFANILGVSLAGLFVVNDMLRRLVMPLAVTIRNIPYVALITILVLTLGDGVFPKVVIVTLSVFFPVLVNTYRGLLSVDPLVLDRMHVLNASRVSVFYHIRMRYALPYFITAQEITGSAAIITSIAAEWLMSTSGLGYVINRGMALYRGDQVYAVSLLAAVLSYLIYSGVGILGARFTQKA